MPGKPVWNTHMPGAEAFVSVQPGMPVACFLLFSERLQGLREQAPLLFCSLLFHRLHLSIWLVLNTQ